MRKYAVTELQLFKVTKCNFMDNHRFFNSFQFLKYQYKCVSLLYVEENKQILKIPKILEKYYYSGKVFFPFSEIM